MKSRVALLYCDNYDPEVVYEKLKKGFELLGGPEKYFDKNEKILVKLNLVRGAEAERAVTTHPAVASAFVRILYEAGCRNMSVGDSCAFGNPVRIMTDLGMAPELEKYGAVMTDCKGSVKTEFPEGIHAKEFILAKEVTEADAIASVCKMKTHALEVITGAVKNQYGVIQGFNKAKGHTVYTNQESFARMLVDLNRCVKPRFYVMDGIIAMEGNGPTSGDPVKMNAIMLSTDPVAIDAVFCNMIGLDPEYVPTNTSGRQMGLGTYLEDEIEVIGEDGVLSFKEIFERWGKPDFNVIRTKHTSKGIMGLVTKLNIFKRKPKINKELCRKCGICVESCPVEGKAIRFSAGRDNPPVYDYKKCIKCFCCQETCPHRAIEVKGKH